jgi:hypothetical protein
VREPAGDAMRLQRLVRGPDDVGQHAGMLTLQSERSRELKQTGGKVHVDGVLSEMLSRAQSRPCHSILTRILRPGFLPGTTG